MSTIHVWGVFDPDGARQLPTGGASSDESPFMVLDAVLTNLDRCGHAVKNLTTTRIPEGLLVGASFETVADANADRMWHQVMRGDAPWGRWSS